MCDDVMNQNRVEQVESSHRKISLLQVGYDPKL